MGEVAVRLVVVPAVNPAKAESAFFIRSDQAVAFGESCAKTPEGATGEACGHLAFSRILLEPHRPVFGVERLPVVFKLSCQVLMDPVVQARKTAVKTLL
jgi:hypothetical protein